MIRLYHFPLSPFCRKVRLTLAEKKLEVELVEERYWEPTPDFLRRNPAGKVPILRIENRTLSESQAICEFLEETYPTPALMPRDPETRYEVRRLCAWFDDKFHDEVTSKLLYERVNKKVMGLGYPGGPAYYPQQPVGYPGSPPQPGYPGPGRPPELDHGFGEEQQSLRSGALGRWQELRPHRRSGSPGQQQQRRRGV